MTGYSSPIRLRKSGRPYAEIKRGVRRERGRPRPSRPRPMAPQAHTDRALRQTRGSFFLKLRSPIQDDVHLHRLGFALRFLDADEMLSIGHNPVVVPALYAGKGEERSRRTGRKLAAWRNSYTHQTAAGLGPPVYTP